MMYLPITVSDKLKGEGGGIGGELRVAIMLHGQGGEYN